MVICQNCKKVEMHFDSVCVFMHENYSTYVCNSCYVSGVILPNVSPLRECNECKGTNEFNDWCFTCLAELVFWRMAKVS